MNTEPRIIPVGDELPPMDVDRKRPAGDSADEPKRTAKHRDRFAPLNAFVDCTVASLTRSEALTWLVLWRDTRDGTARTSMANIARRIGTSRRTVTAAIGKLRGRGLLTLAYRGGLNRGVSVYRVHPLAGEP